MWKGCNPPVAPALSIILTKSSVSMPTVDAAVAIRVSKLLPEQSQF